MKWMILTSLFILLGACSTSSGNEQASSDIYAEVHAAAAGDDERAIQLANSARLQAELAAKQADIEAGIWEERVLAGN